MDRRFKCADCGAKWFVPSSRPELPDPSRCENCGGALVSFADAGEAPTALLPAGPTPAPMPAA